MMENNIIANKSYSFAVRVIRAYRYLQKHNEYILSKQLIRCGTSIGALVAESKFAQSKADFINKLSIALKEANEAQYWIMLLKDTEILDCESADSLLKDAQELTAILVKIITSSKS